MRPLDNAGGQARIWVACFLLVAWWWYRSLPSTLLSAVAASLMAEQEHNCCEMYLETGRMIYVMNHDKRDEFTFCIIASLMQYKHQFPTTVPAAQWCDALFQDLTALWAVCWAPAVSPSPAETHLHWTTASLAFPLAWNWSLVSVLWQSCSLPARGLSSWARFLPGTMGVPASPSLYLKLSGLEEDAVS